MPPQPKNRENQEKIGKKRETLGSLPLRTGRAGHARGSRLYIKIIHENEISFQTAFAAIDTANENNLKYFKDQN